MKLAKISLTAIALATSTVTMAGTIKTPLNVELLVFDGAYLPKGKKAEVNDNKTHQMVVNIGDIIDGSYFSLPPMVLTFEGVNEDIEVVVPEFRSKSAVERFKKELNIQLKTASGKVIPHKQDVLKGEGFAPNARTEDNLSKYNLGNGVAAVSAFATKAFEAKGQVVVDTKNVKEDQLQSLFLKADKATQQRFLEWAKKNAK